MYGLETDHDSGCHLYPVMGMEKDERLPLNDNDLKALAAQHLIHIRNNIGITQEEMSYAIDEPYDTIKKWESGRHMPPMKAQKKYDALVEMAAENDIVEKAKQPFLKKNYDASAFNRIFMSMFRSKQ